MAKRLTLTFVSLLIVAAGLLPVLSMLIGSVWADGHFSLLSYAEMIKSARQWALMGNSMLLSTLVTLLTVSVGVPLGIVLGKTDLPFRRFFTLLFTTPLLIPPYIIAVAWSDLLGREGLLATLLGESAADAAAHLLFGLPGALFVFFSIFLPIPMLLTIIFLRTINPRLEEAGRLVSDWRTVLKGITIPLILPGVLLSAILVFLLTFGEFSVPNFLRYDVFPVESFTQFSAFYNFKAATAAAVPLIVVTLILLLAEALFLRERTYQLRPSAGIEPLPPIALGVHRKWVFILVALGGLALVALPLVALLIQSAGIEVYAEAMERAGDALLRSLIYALIGATLLTIIGFFTGYMIQMKALPFWRSADTMTFFLFALPGTVIGIGLISLWNTPWTNLVYSTPLIILLGYIAKYTVLSSRITVAQLAQIPTSMEEAAQIAGAGWFRRMVYIVIPLARRGIMAAWIVAYIFSLRDTDVTMLVYPAGDDTLPIRIFTLMANGAPELIAALCVLMILATLLPAAILWIIAKGKKGEI